MFWKKLTEKDLDQLDTEVGLKNISEGESLRRTEIVRSMDYDNMTEI